MDIVPASDTDLRTYLCRSSVFLDHGSPYFLRVLELQVFLVEVINNFESRMTEEASNVIRVPSFVMVAMIKGQEEKRVQTPLKIKPAPPEEDF